MELDTSLETLETQSAGEELSSDDCSWMAKNRHLTEEEWQKIQDERLFLQNEVSKLDDDKKRLANEHSILQRQLDERNEQIEKMKKEAELKDTQIAKMKKEAEMKDTQIVKLQKELEILRRPEVKKEKKSGLESPKIPQRKNHPSILNHIAEKSRSGSNSNENRSYTPMQNRGKEKHPSILNHIAEKSRSGLKSSQNGSDSPMKNRGIEVIEILSDDEDNSNTSVSRKSHISTPTRKNRSKGHSYSDSQSLRERNYARKRTQQEPNEIVETPRKRRKTNSHKRKDENQSKTSKYDPNMHWVETHVGSEDPNVKLGVPYVFCMGRDMRTVYVTSQLARTSSRNKQDYWKLFSKKITELPNHRQLLRELRSRKFEQCEEVTFVDKNSWRSRCTFLEMDESMSFANIYDLNGPDLQVKIECLRRLETTDANGVALTRVLAFERKGFTPKPTRRSARLKRKTR